ncbi:amino acid ABC transporter permease [Brenneria tiliae]|uniref:Amino acid ABC transporter permease n=1 Tax=Brenneria tiliae TaxID=2914984 RepID=A0ABT0MP73_9GAMM|nr:amino acid ABC transporter permease [Brenneria tiliae]MCL2891638.1 amino acid ABC transporter permease [Brenneria tiliae]
MSEIVVWLPVLLAGLRVTLKIAAISFVLSLFLGLALALARLYGGRVLRLSASAFIELFRGTPLLTQMLIIYFSLGSLGLLFSAFTAAVIAITLNSAAYMSEIFRSGIISVDSGQKEAALSIGMTEFQSFRYSVLPQAVRVIIPPMTNYAVIIIKSTSLASAITAPELMMQAHSLSSEYFKPTEIYALTAGIYILIAYPLSLVTHLLERHLAQQDNKPSYF